MRSALLVVACYTATTAHAQGLVGGIVVDSATRAPLPCLDVVVEDATGRALTRTQTGRDGTFAAPAPERGVFRLRFELFNHPPTVGPRDSLDAAASSTRMGQYVVPVRVPPLRTEAAPDSAADAPPWPRETRVGPRYPPALRDRGVQGAVLVQYVVDSTGAVEQPSVRVVQATAPEFAASVREFLTRVRYRPARRDRVPACALLVQPFLFQLSY